MKRKFFYVPCRFPILVLNMFERLNISVLQWSLFSKGEDFKGGREIREISYKLS